MLFPRDGLYPSDELLPDEEPSHGHVRYDEEFFKADYDDDEEVMELIAHFLEAVE